MTSWPPAASAASAAALASSDSRAMVNTMPGSTTPEVRGSSGRFSVSGPSILRTSPDPGSGVLEGFNREIERVFPYGPGRGDSAPPQRSRPESAENGVLPGETRGPFERAEPDARAALRLPGGLGRGW